MSTFYTCSVVTNRGTSIEPIHDLLTVTGSGGQASIPHRIVESSSIGYFDRIQHFILTKAEVEQLRANTNIWNISYQTPIHEWEFRGIGHVNRHTSLNPTFNPPATNQELLTASFTPATLTNPGGYNPVSIEHFISGGEHLLIEDTQTNRRLDIHRNFETGSYVLRDEITSSYNVNLTAQTQSVPLDSNAFPFSRNSIQGENSTFFYAEGSHVWGTDSYQNTIPYPYLSDTRYMHFADLIAPDYDISGGPTVNMVDILAVEGMDYQFNLGGLEGVMSANNMLKSSITQSNREHNLGLWFHTAPLSEIYSGSGPLQYGGDTVLKYFRRWASGSISTRPPNGRGYDHASPGRFGLHWTRGLIKAPTESIHTGSMPPADNLSMTPGTYYELGGEDGPTPGTWAFPISSQTNNDGTPFIEHGFILSGALDNMEHRHRRINKFYNPIVPIKPTNNAHPYTFHLTGKGVDLVNGERFMHRNAAWIDLNTGKNRFKPINWHVTTSTADLYGSQWQFMYHPAASSTARGHGDMTMGIASSIDSWGKENSIHTYANFIVSNPEMGLVDIDVVSRWHTSKSIESSSGYRKPTVMTLSLSPKSTYCLIAQVTGSQATGSFVYPASSMGSGRGIRINYNNRDYCFISSSNNLQSFPADDAGNTRIDVEQINVDTSKGGDMSEEYTHTNLFFPGLNKSPYTSSLGDVNSAGGNIAHNLNISVNGHAATTNFYYFEGGISGLVDKINYVHNHAYSQSMGPGSGSALWRTWGYLGMFHVTASHDGDTLILSSSRQVDFDGNGNPRKILTDTRGIIRVFTGSAAQFLGLEAQPCNNFKETWWDAGDHFGDPTGVYGAGSTGWHSSRYFGPSKYSSESGFVPNNWQTYTANEGETIYNSNDFNYNIDHVPNYDNPKGMTFHRRQLDFTPCQPYGGKHVLDLKSDTTHSSGIGKLVYRGIDVTNEASHSNVVSNEAWPQSRWGHQYFPNHDHFGVDNGWNSKTTPWPCPYNGVHYPTPEAFETSTSQMILASSWSANLDPNFRYSPARRQYSKYIPEYNAAFNELADRGVVACMSAGNEGAIMSATGSTEQDPYFTSSMYSTLAENYIAYKPDENGIYQQIYWNFNPNNTGSGDELAIVGGYIGYKEEDGPYKNPDNVFYTNRTTPNNGSVIKVGLIKTDPQEGLFNDAKSRGKGEFYIPLNPDLGYGRAYPSIQNCYNTGPVVDVYALGNHLRFPTGYGTMPGDAAGLPLGGITSPINIERQTTNSLAGAIQERFRNEPGFNEHGYDTEFVTQFASGFPTLNTTINSYFNYYNNLSTEQLNNAQLMGGSGQSSGGTSAATPQVAGQVMLFMQINQAAKVDDVRRYLKFHGHKLIKNHGDKNSTPIYRLALSSSCGGAGYEVSDNTGQSDPRYVFLSDGGVSGSSFLGIDGDGVIAHMPFSSPFKNQLRSTFKKK